MIENSNPEGVKRHTPSAQRVRSLSWRKSGERLQKTNGIVGEKSRASYPRNSPSMDHEEAGGSNVQDENTHPGLIPIYGCCTSEAAQLLNERKYADASNCDRVLEFSCIFLVTEIDVKDVISYFLVLPD